VALLGKHLDAAVSPDARKLTQAFTEHPLPDVVEHGAVARDDYPSHVPSTTGRDREAGPQ
jgi:hypothetical protein